MHTAMPGSVGDRLLRSGTPVGAHRRSTMALILAGLGLAATALGLLTAALPHPPVAHPAFQLWLTLLGLPSAAALLVLRHRLGERLPLWLLHAWVAVSVVMICVGSWTAVGTPTSIASTGFFVWIGLYVGNFFAARAVVAHLAWLAACLAVLELVEAPPGAAGVGVMVFGITAATAGAATHLARTLGRAATTDILTGLPNRQGLLPLLTRELGRCERGGALCLAVVDVDLFKRVNDADGHGAGDRLLVALAGAWRSELRAGDLLARYGGDEFVVLMPDCGAAEAVEVLGRLRAAGRHPCSVGISRWTPGDTVESILHRADAALYRAKDEGRDRVVLA